VKRLAVHLLSGEHAAGLRVVRPELDADAYIACAQAAREAGTDYEYAILDGNRLVGVCRLHNVESTPEVRVWTAEPGRGDEKFATALMLELAFTNLQLSTVGGLTRAEWASRRADEARAELHPALRAVLDAELAAGNEVAEQSADWPEPGSVFVRMREPFRARIEPVPDGVVFSELDDPHWWKAEYATGRPRHVIAC